MSSALIIEDDPHIAYILSITLQVVKFETEVALDGQIALNRLAETTPDVIILDLCLPYVSGQAILAHIQTQKRLAKTSVIVVTGDVLRGEAMKNKVDHVFIKPFSPAELRHAAQAVSS